MRATNAIRQLCYLHGKGPSWVFTNKYKHCRTVKCSYTGNDQPLIDDVSAWCAKNGVKLLEVRKIIAPYSAKWVPCNSLIFRIPL